jgi:hypothetical protein
MTTSQQRIARMRKSFEKNKYVLTEDYKYFATLDKPAKQRAKPPEPIQNANQTDKHRLKENSNENAAHAVPE